MEEHDEKIRALLIGVCLLDEDIAAKNASMEELERLVDTAGITTSGKYIKRKDRKGARTYAGQGFIKRCLEKEEIDILIFDNGVERRHSRIVELNPASGSIEWQYVANPPESFFSNFRGSCQRLPNGNTLVCQGSNGRIFELTVENEIVWEYVSPHLGPVDPDAGRFGSTNIYRAYRVPTEWIPKGVGK